jgi:hypothetical protein
MERVAGRRAFRILEGTGISTLWPQMLALGILDSAILTLSVLRFHISGTNHGSAARLRCRRRASK